MSPNSADVRKKMSDALNNGGVPEGSKILSFKQKAPAAKEGKIDFLQFVIQLSFHKIQYITLVQKKLNTGKFPGLQVQSAFCIFSLHC